MVALGAADGIGRSRWYIDLGLRGPSLFKACVTKLSSIRESCPDVENLGHEPKSGRDA